MNPLLELADRVEAATRPNRSIESAIGHAVDVLRIRRTYCGQPPEPMNGVPHFMSSLDAALTLAPEGWEAAVTRQEDGRGVGHCYRDPGAYFEARAATPALALTAASLRAIASMGSSG